jgi:GNAT superfamily N-acetyltransferase
MVGDAELARRLEGFQAAVSAELGETMQRVRPAVGAEVLRLGEGAAVFAGVGSPITQAVGVALGVPITPADFHRLESLFLDRGADAMIQVSPWTDASLITQLSGYEIAEFENVFVRELRNENASTAIAIVEIGEEDVALWARIGAEAFATAEMSAEVLVEVMTPFAYAPNARCYVATVDGEPAGAAAAVVSRDARIVGLFGASTLPPFRRRGIQTALLQRRLSDAATSGCDLALVTTLPGSASHRNVVRRGFDLAYTKVTMRRRPGGRTPA